MNTTAADRIEAADLSLARAQRRERLRASLAHEHDPLPPAPCPAREVLLARSEAWSHRVRVLLGPRGHDDAAT